MPQHDADYWIEKALLSEDHPDSNVVDALFAVADGLNNIAEAIRTDHENRTHTSGYGKTGDSTSPA